jgi:hypothetical protein
MAKGWMIGVMVELAGEPKPLRHFFAVGCEDRAKAEWRAVDRAMKLGPVATSPVGGLEPVHAVAELTARTIAAQALKPDEIRALGWKWPRLWLPVEVTAPPKE